MKAQTQVDCFIAKDGKCQVYTQDVAKLGTGWRLSSHLLKHWLQARGSRPRTHVNCGVEPNFHEEVQADSPTPAGLRQGFSVLSRGPHTGNR